MPSIGAAGPRPSQGEAYQEKPVAHRLRRGASESLGRTAHILAQGARIPLEVGETRDTQRYAASHLGQTRDTRGGATGRHTIPANFSHGLNTLAMIRRWV